MTADTLLVITGRGIGCSYRAFAREKMAALSLSGSVETDGTIARLAVHGEEALVDMLEVACLLGPVDCIVERIERVRHEAYPGGER